MRWVAAALALSLAAPRARAQVVASGQASAWLASKPDTALVSETGLRYIPEVALQRPLGGSDSLAVDLSLAGSVTADFGRGALPRYDAALKPYRAWLRWASPRFETRVGLQKINFGSATLFRPLMWFDRVDPRDPLQLTNGVTGALARYYFPDNVNVWAWALAGNAALKGWETARTARGTVEFGGRIQAPVPAGEVAATYHHREADAGPLPSLTHVPEDRYGLDGKWDLGVGLWGEAALVRQDTGASPAYQRFWTVGADYTVGVGNGLYLLAEQSRFDLPASAFGGGPGADLSGLLANYPVGLLDRVSAIVYRNWSARQWYRIVTWQRTYDVWSFYLLAFWNPAQPAGVGLGTGQGAQAFAGRGLELMATFNH